jgi:small subunit ribosomal protein S27Ae
MMAGSGENWKKSKPSKYAVEDGKLVRKQEFCPEDGCGPGVFLAIHSDRKHCGRCGYTKKNE